MAIMKIARIGIMAFLVAVLVGSGAILTAPASFASETGAVEQPAEASDAVDSDTQAPTAAAPPVVEAQVTEVANEKIIVDVTGTDFGGLSVSNEPAAISIAVAEKDVDLTTLDPEKLPSIAAAVAADGTLTGYSAALEAGIEALEASKTYEVVTWLSGTALITENLLARSDLAIDWAALLPATDASESATPSSSESDAAAAAAAAAATAAEASDTTTTVQERVASQTRGIDVDVTEITNSKIVLTATGYGFQDVPPLGSPPKAHVYLGLIEKGTDLAGIGQDSGIPTVAVNIKADGTFDETDFWADFEESAGNLDPAKQYEVISWPARSNPTTENLYARTDITIDWVTLFTGATVETTVVGADEHTGLELEVNAQHISAADTRAGVTVAFFKKGVDKKFASNAAKSVFVPSVTSGALQQTLVVPPSRLERGAQYEVVLFGGVDFALNEDLRIATSSVTVRNSDWEKIFPTQTDGKKLIVDTVAVPNEKVVVEVLGSGFQDVKALPGQSTPHVYLALVPKGIDLSTVSEDTSFSNVSVEIRPDGTFGNFSAPLEQDIALLDRTKSYEVISWPSRSNPTNDTLYARAEARIDWSALFPAGAVSGTASVSSASESGLTVSTTLQNLDPAKFTSGVQMAVVLRGTANGAGSFLGSRATVSTVPASGSVSGDSVIPRDQLDRHALYEVVVWPADAATPRSSNIIRTIPFTVSQAQWDSVFPAAPPATTTPAAGALIWGVSDGFRGYVVGRIAKGDVRTSGVGGGPGGYLFPQATSENWDRSTNTGTVQYSGSVTFWGHSGLMNESFSNPVITVSGPNSGSISVAGRGTFPLAISSGSMSKNADGSVTWRNVPINGEVCGGGSGGGASGGGCFSLDPVTFTIGSVSAVSYGATVEGSSTKPKRTPAATAPSTTGVRVLTDPEKIKAGGRIEIEASDFDANDEGVLVVLYSDPIVLDDSAKANARGVVTWQGTLPDDITGEHVITLQGSTNAGAIIKIVDEEDKKAAEAKKKLAEERLADQQIAAAGIFGGSGTSGMALWEWWASAAGLVVIAACTTTLAVRQRRSS